MSIKISMNKLVFAINELGITDEDYCKVSLNFKSELVNINIENEELLTISDLKRLHKYLQSMLDRTLKNSGTLKFLNNDLQIELHPEYNVRNESAVLFVDPDFGVINMYGFLKVNLYDLKDKQKEYSNNYLSFYLDENDFVILKDYIEKKIECYL